jgi:hypothetical protein
VPWPRSAADRQALEDFCKDMRMCDCQPLRRRERMQYWVRCFSTKDEAQRVAERFVGQCRLGSQKGRASVAREGEGGVQ